MNADDGELGFAAAAVAQVAQSLGARGWMMATAESCTGGLIAACCTDLAGSSAWLERGFITYSNEAKQDMLNVPEGLLAAHGAVSEPVARAMAEGALAHSRADVSVSVTGIAGPGGAVPGKPVGTVWLGWAVKGAAGAAPEVGARLLQLQGNRQQVRRATVLAALAQVAALAATSGSLSG